MNKHTYLQKGTAVSFKDASGNEKKCTILGHGNERGNLTMYQLEYKKTLPDGSLMKIKFYLREHELSILKETDVKEKN